MAKLIALYLYSAIILLLNLESPLRPKILQLLIFPSLLFLGNLIILDFDNSFPIFYLYICSFSNYLRWSEILNIISGLSIVSILDIKLLDLREMNYCYCI